MSVMNHYYYFIVLLIIVSIISPQYYYYGAGWRLCYMLHADVVGGRPLG